MSKERGCERRFRRMAVCHVKMYLNMNRWKNGDGMGSRGLTKLYMNPEQALNENASFMMTRQNALCK